MSFNLKHALLAGTALIAVGALASAAQAADLTLTGASTYGVTAPVNTPTAGDNIIMGANNLTINNTLNTAIGAITSTTGTVTITDSAAANLTQTIGSFTSTGAGSFAVTGTDPNTANITVGVTGNLTTGTAGTLSITNTETSTADLLNLNVGGAVSVAGATTLQAGAFAGATSNLTVTGNSTFTGGVTATGGAGAGSNAVLNLNGASNDFGTGLNLVTATKSKLNLAGATAQTVTGAITGAGDITVANASGATFNSAVTAGTVTIENGGAALGSSATFKAAVTAPITLGGAGTGTNVVTFDGTTAGFAVTGAIAGAIAGETNNIIVTNTSGTAKTISIDTASTANLDNLTVSGTGTVLDSNAALTLTGVTTINSGAKLDVGAGLLTSPSVVNNGTLQLTGVGGITGILTGTGLLDVDAAAAINGAITQGTADIAAVTLTQTTASGYTVGTTNFSGNGTLALAAGSQTVTGNFTNTTDGQGTITVANGAGTTTIAGDLGAGTTNSLAAFDFQNAGPTGQIVRTTGNWFVDATRLDASDELTFSGTAPQTVSGTISGYAAGEGLLIVGSGATASDVTFNGVIGTTTLLSGTVNAGATAHFNQNATFSTSFGTNATGKTYVGQGATITADSFNNAGTYYLNAVDAGGTLTTGDFGHLADSSNNGSLTASNLNIILTGDVGVGTVRFLTGINTGAAVLADNSIQYTFTTADNTTHTDVTVARASNVALAAGTNNTGVAAALDGTTTSTDPQLVMIEDNLAKATTTEDFNNILESAGPTVDGGIIVGGFNASVQSLDVTNTRLASLRNGNETGMVAGDLSNGMTTWVQGFGQSADQDTRNSVKGYEADTYGMAVGMDTSGLMEDGTVGMALSYANTDVDSKNANATNADIDSYQASVYGTYDVAPQTYVAGTVAFAWNDIDQVRHNVGAISGLNASADYDSNQYIAYLETGHDFNIGNGLTLTPSALAHYQHISIDGYTETGAGGANLNVSDNDLDILELGVGAELAMDIDAGHGSKLRPSINAGYRHDVIGDDVSSTSNFTGGGASFETNGLEPAKGTGNVGAAITYAMENSWEFTADYDYEMKSDYDAHSGFVRAGYKF